MSEPQIDSLNPRYEGDPATDPQLKLLTKLAEQTSRKIPADLTKRQAHELICELQRGSWMTVVEVRNACECPECGAPIRLPCRRSGGMVRKANHKRRVTLAVKLRRGG